MKTIAIANLKGGEAKSTTVVNLAYELVVTHGKRVLVVDTDQNMGATKMLLPPEKGRNTITAIITGLTDYPYDQIYKTAYPGLDIIPADVELAIYGTNSFARGDCSLPSIADLGEALAEDDAYDYILIDSAPGMAAAFACAIYAADMVIIPMTMDPLGLDGMQDLTAQISGVRDAKRDVRIAGCLITKFQSSAETIEDLSTLREASGGMVYRNVIRQSPVVYRAKKAGIPVTKFSPRSSAGADYKTWAIEFLRREEGLK